MYSFGGGQCGKHGHGSDEDEPSPKMVDALRHVRIAAAAAGGGHSLALTEYGVVFSLGLNNAGQLVLGQSCKVESLPQKVEALSGLKVCAVAAGYQTSCAVTSAGELYTCGRGYRWLLGHGDEVTQLAPKRVETLRDEWSVAVSPGIYHTIAVTRAGRVFGWGAAIALGMPEAEDSDEDDKNEAGVAMVLVPRRYPQLSCAPRS